MVIFDEEYLKKEVFEDIKKVLFPLMFVVSFIIVASFLGTFLISSALVYPLIELKERILNLFVENFNPNWTENTTKAKDIECINGITTTCWLFTDKPYKNLLSISEKASKVCPTCKIFIDNSKDKIVQLSYSFMIMVSSLNNFISKLEKAHKEKETLSCMAAMGEMSARLAHEIKNALYSISNAVNYINQNTEDKTIKDFGKIIKDEANRLNEITIYFLNFSKLLEPKMEKGDINKTTMGAFELLKYDCEDEDINLVLLLDPELLPIEHNPNLIKQVLFNLAINSIDAIKQKGTNSVDQIVIRSYRTR
ncbi:MAG: hypothetical protein N2Z80_01870 [Hydrogenothermaceae bacterium]|nr:hypothetical protein [Hydrogenothermaceae bacterium]